MEKYSEIAIGLLKQLITTPSFSKEEHDTAKVLEDFLSTRGVLYERSQNNIWAKNKYYDESKPTILLNSHHDTVKPNAGYTNDPFEAKVENGKLFGLGSNDAGGCLVSLILTFLHFYEEKGLQYNFILAATAEEEISGKNGISALYPLLPKISFAIVGEPTLMDAAVAEKGLIVVDATVEGVSGHAAREEGDNAIYKALKDLEWISTFVFPKESKTLGRVKMSATQVNAGTQHNVVPDRCSYVLDIRVTDEYTNQEVVDIIDEHTCATINPRSLRLTSSSIDVEHPIVVASVNDGAKTYGSPTMSDQALMNIPSLKMGPGDSARSHSPNEYIYIEEIKEGIEKYISRLSAIIR